MDDQGSTVLSAEQRRWIAVGRIIEEAGHMESTVRRAFCALLGSEYAPVVAAKESVSNLVDFSTAIAKIHRDISDDDDRKELDEALIACKVAADHRNMIHGAWGYGEHGEAVLIRTVKRSYKLTTEPKTVEELDAVQMEIVQATSRLDRVLTRAFGRDASIEAKLRWEDYLASKSEAEHEEMARRALSTRLTGDDLELAVREAVEQVRAVIRRSKP